MIGKERKITFTSIAALIVMVMLISYPVRSLLASYYYHRAASFPEETTANQGNAFPVSDATMPHYLEAIRHLETASALAPWDTAYRKALSEIYLRLGTWAAAMEGMKTPLPIGAPSSREAFEKASLFLHAAIRREPTNPDFHYALGCLYDMIDKNSGLPEKELARAIMAYPVNAPLRYAVAMQHLNAGRRGDALEHAAILVKIDDTGAWMFRAFEIAWRASNDPRVVKGLAAGNPEVMDMAQKFLASKGISEQQAE